MGHTHTSEKAFTPVVIQARFYWLRLCWKKWSVKALMINHIIILTPALPQGSSSGDHHWQSLVVTWGRKKFSSETLWFLIVWWREKVLQNISNMSVVIPLSRTYMVRTFHIWDQYHFYHHHHHHHHYQCFRRIYCLHLQGKNTLKMRAAGSSEMLVTT
jgi:hypothetical protein